MSFDFLWRFNLYGLIVRQTNAWHSFDPGLPTALRCLWQRRGKSGSGLQSCRSPAPAVAAVQPPRQRHLEGGRIPVMCNPSEGLLGNVQSF